MENKMTSMPWKTKKFINWATNVCGKGEDNDVCEMSCTHNKATQNANATAIVSAVNNTYGKNIDPEAIPELVRTLKNMCDYFEWLTKDPDFLAYREAKAAIDKAIIK